MAKNKSLGSMPSSNSGEKVYFYFSKRKKILTSFWGAYPSNMKDRQKTKKNYNLKCFL